MRTSQAWERFRALEASPEFERVLAAAFPYRNVALAILDLRGRLGLTQQQLAERVGTTQSVIARAESGTHPIEVTLLSRIAEATGEPLIVGFGNPGPDHQPGVATAEVHEGPGEYETSSGDELLDAFNQANTAADFETAREIVERMQEEALTPRRRVALALTAANQGDFPAAAQWAGEALEGDLPAASRDVATLVHGKALLNLRKPQKALRSLSEPADKAPYAWLIRAARADAYVELGRSRRAMDEVRIGVALAGGKPAARYHAARTAWHADQIWEALDHIALFRAAEPESHDGAMLYGSILGYIGSEYGDRDALTAAHSVFKHLLPSDDCEAVRLYAVTAMHLGEWRVAFRAASKLLRHRPEDGGDHADHSHYVQLHFLPQAFETLESLSHEQRAAAIDDAERRFGTLPIIASQRALLRAQAGDLPGTLAALGIEREKLSAASPTDQSIIAAAMYYRQDFVGAYRVLRDIEAELSRPDGLLRLAECAAAAGEVDDAQRVLGALAEGPDTAGRVAQVAMTTIGVLRAIHRAAVRPSPDLRWSALIGSDVPRAPRETLWEGEHHPTTPMLESWPARSRLN